MKSSALSLLFLLSPLCLAACSSSTRSSPPGENTDAGDTHDAARDATTSTLDGDTSAQDGSQANPTDGGSTSDVGTPPVDAGSTFDAALGSPITAANDTWTWVDFPESSCDNGTPTGIGVYKTSASDKLAVYFEGGGACWDYETCAVVGAYAHGPYGATQFASHNFTNSIVDPTVTSNPFKDWNYIYVPYCTGDLHAGNAPVTYTSDGGTKKVDHVGHSNVLAYLTRIAATFTAPSEIAITGSSAGGGGALFNYSTFRAYYPSATMILVDDSLPLFEQGAVNATTVSDWVTNWHLEGLFGSGCSGCATSPALYMKFLADAYPNDRMSLLESEQDGTISGYYSISGSAFQTDLNALATNELDPTSNFRHFFIAGSSHTMLGNPGGFSSSGTALWTWLSEQATGSTSWVSVGP